MANNKDNEVETCLTELRSVCQTITITGLSQMVKVNFVDQLFAGIVGIANSTERFDGPLPSLDVFGLNRHDPNYLSLTPANRVMKEAAAIVDDCCDFELSTAADIHVLSEHQLNLVWAEIVSMTPPVLKMLAAEHFYTNLCSGQFERTLWRPFLGLQYLNLNRDEQTYVLTQLMSVCRSITITALFLRNLVKQQNKLMVNQINSMAKQDNLTEEQAKKLENFSKMMEEHGKAFALVFKVNNLLQKSAPALRLFVIKIDHFSLVAN
ncbi:hypothetical protein niasHT_034970 [Heterodera trifolii]|uniref:Uncharacterized protein n=1 Tax=Heterodera trifolii TaxID=157864 RepID=A0ABD2IQL1_9BILA